MKPDSKLAIVPRRAARFNPLFILIILFGTLAFVACISVTGDGPAPSLGLIIDQDMRVIDVVPGGAADLGGVKQGDILKKLNDRELTTPIQARNAFNRADRTQIVTLVLVRDNNEITVQVQLARTIGVPGAKTATPIPPDLTYF